MPIEENRSFRRLRNQVKSFSVLDDNPEVLRLLGATEDAIVLLQKKVQELAPRVSRLTREPDRFNRVFRARGWIAFGWMSTDVMRGALDFADKEMWDEADQALAEYFDRGTIELGLGRLWGVTAIHKRARLLRLALEDHCSGRFHASIPVLLAQIDGIVHDVARKTFYASKAEGPDHLVAEDSIAGHPEGLQALAILMSSRRSQTTDTLLDIPFRHGVLHGRDLAYDSHKTSSKCFAVILALGEWAQCVEAGEDLPAPLEWPDPDELTWDNIQPWLAAILASGR